MSLPNRPGVAIDGATYLRLRPQIDEGNVVGMLIGADATLASGEFWAAELKSLKNLRELHIGEWNLTIGASHPAPGPQIRQIFGSLANLNALEDLSLRGWELALVPEGIRKLRRLKRLDLSGLGLEDLPDWIGCLELETLEAADNRLTDLPSSFRQLKQLKSLDLAWNPLERSRRRFLASSRLSTFNSVTAAFARSRRKYFDWIA